MNRNPRLASPTWNDNCSCPSWYSLPTSPIQEASLIVCSHAKSRSPKDAKNLPRQIPRPHSLQKNQQACEIQSGEGWLEAVHTSRRPGQLNRHTQDLPLVPTASFPGPFLGFCPLLRDITEVGPVGASPEALEREAGSNQAPAGPRRTRQ